VRSTETQTIQLAVRDIELRIFHLPTIAAVNFKFENSNLRLK